MFIVCSWWKSDAGSAKCTKCDAGEAGTGINGTCEVCQSGQYLTSIMDATTCEECPTGFSQNDLGQTSCTKCSPGEFNVTGADECKNCLKLHTLVKKEENLFVLIVESFKCNNILWILFRTI